MQQETPCRVTSVKSVAEIDLVTRACARLVEAIRVQTIRRAGKANER